MVKIMIADDQQLIRESLKIILDSDPNFEVVKVVGSGQEVLDTLETESIDIILMDVRMPSMILQPIVENAITHGIEELDADAVIEIKGIEHEKSFEIEITDSGTGMSEKQLAILRRKLRMRLNSDTQPKHGIGLRNVQDRIHIQFGTEYGLSVYTKEHCYTKVSIHLPITRGKYSPMDQEGDEKEEEKENEYTAGCRR